MKRHHKDFTIIIERDEDGYYVASVLELKGCHTQAKTQDKLMERIREAIELYLEALDESTFAPTLEFIGIQKMAMVQ
jgi:predicted RNase H-like HicB family nuclease